MALWWLFLVACTQDADDTGDTDADDPEIADVLDCGTVGPAGGLGGGNEMQRYDFDTAEYPDAICNDGTPAFFYFRPHEGAANTDRWLIQLQGGGACITPDDCFARWCSVDTNFGMQGMTANESPAQTDGRGIMRRRADNPFGDFNHVFVRYCSSDTWSGSADPLATGAHPTTGEEVTARLHFHGWDIVTSVVEVLQSGDLDFTLLGGDVPMPDLDDADVVVLAGGSAGGAGTVHNADRLGTLLRETNPDLPQYGALIDSAFAPSASHYDYTHTELCTVNGVCDFETHMRATSVNDADFRGLHAEESCAAAHPGDDAWMCSDGSHLVANHITTPFLGRMGQTDELISSNQIETGFWYDGGPLTLAQFALLVQQDMAAMADPAGNEEAASYTLAPAVFSPTCPGHEVLNNDDQVYDVTIHSGSEDLTMFQVLARWRGDLTPSVLIAATPDDDVCP